MLYEVITSFLMALINAVLAETTLLHPSRIAAFFREGDVPSRLGRMTGARTLAFTAFALSLVLCYGWYRLATLGKPETTLAVSMRNNFV